MSHRSRWRKINGSQLWISLVSTVLLGVVLWWVIRTMGYVEGEEFSPTHFRSRQFSFYEIPIIHWQITPIDRSSSTPPAALLVTQRKWVSPPSAPPAIWHLVSLRRGAGETKDADAALLVRQLRLQSDGGPFWSQWSQEHPKLARVLWPTIGTLAQRELYILMPRLLELVRPIDRVDVLQATQLQYLQTQYASLVRDMQAAGQEDLAAALIAEAAQDMHQSSTTTTVNP